MVKESKPLTIEHSIIANTSGYDIHYIIANDESDNAYNLLTDCLRFIKTLRTDDAAHLIFHTQHNQPVGPWCQAMWEIQISTVDSTDASDPNATDENKLKAIHAVMKTIAAYLQHEIETRQMHGSLFIHANTWPKNADQVFERQLHYDHPWLVCGAPVSLQDIWSGSNGLIAMEVFVKQKLQEDRNDKTIIDAFTTAFKNNEFFSTERVIRLANELLIAQHRLRQLQQRCAKVQAS